MDKDNFPQCTIHNVKNFIETFLEENKGMGRYVDALSTDIEYEVTFPNKMDFRYAISNPYAPDDPDYDPDVTNTEKIYLYVTPTVTVHDTEEKVDGRSVTTKTRMVSYEWTSIGQRDFTKAYKTAEHDDIAECIKRDQVISKLLKRLSQKHQWLQSSSCGQQPMAHHQEVPTGIAQPSFYINCAEAH